MYRNDASYGRHQCSCRRKRLNDMDYNRTKQCTSETKQSSYSGCTGTAGKSTYPSCTKHTTKPTYPSCTKHATKPTYSGCSKHTEKHSYSKPLIVDATFTKPTYNCPSQQGHTGCGCTRCKNKHRGKRYICHCYESD